MTSQLINKKLLKEAMFDLCRSNDKLYGIAK